MIDDHATAEVSEDGRRIFCRSADGSVRWTQGAPSSLDWQRLATHPVSLDPEEGKFQYAGDEFGGVITAVFTPRLGLDFNLRYSAETGNLIAINEAR